MDERRDVRAKIRTYEKDGEKKNYYITVGTAWVSEHGSKISITLDALPVAPEWDNKLYVNKPYEPTEKTKYDIGDAFGRADTKPKDTVKEVTDEPIDMSQIPF